CASMTRSAPSVNVSVMISPNSASPMCDPGSRCCAAKLVMVRPCRLSMTRPQDMPRASRGRLARHIDDPSDVNQPRCRSHVECHDMETRRLRVLNRNVAESADAGYGNPLSGPCFSLLDSFVSRDP